MMNTFDQQKKSTVVMGAGLALSRERVPIDEAIKVNPYRANFESHRQVLVSLLGHLASYKLQDQTSSRSSIDIEFVHDLKGPVMHRLLVINNQAHFLLDENLKKLPPISVQDNDYEALLRVAGELMHCWAGVCCIRQGSTRFCFDSRLKIGVWNEFEECIEAVISHACPLTLDAPIYSPASI